MINGFEEETAPLTEDELAMVPKFINGFRNKIGEGNAVTSTTIIDKMEQLGYKMSGPRVRKIINHIRVNKLMQNLVATSRGYYIENDPEKVMAYVAGLKARADAIMAVANSYDLNYQLWTT